MYALFLETKAASECAKYAISHGLDVEKLQQDAYANSKIGVYGANQDDDWWVNKCLSGDAHKNLNLNLLFLWRRTPQGEGFWRDVYRGGR